MASELTLQDTVKIQKLFTHQKWNIDEANKSSLYNRYIHTYKQLEPDERELFINLSYQFEIIPFDYYPKILGKVLSNVFQKYMGKKQTIYIYPIKKGAHKDFIKSSDLVTYLCNSTQLKYTDALSKKKIVLLGSIKQIKSQKNRIINSSLLIVDDFIGSGKYTSDVISELILLGIPKDQIIVATLFITQAGIKRLHQKEYHLEYGEVVKSCIETLTASQKKVLDGIEKKMGVNQDFSFGFGCSGTLISLIRTPNNTLPIFWMPSGQFDSPPFPRYE